MKVVVTDVTQVKKSMAIEVDPDVVEKETRSVLRGYARKAKIPGFRPGKAPLAVVHARYAREVEEDVRERVMTESYRKATEERKLEPIGNPVVDEVIHEHGKPLKFKTTFEVLPEFELKSYKGVEARRPSSTVTDEDVDKFLEELRQQRVQLQTDEGRKAATGDVLVADVMGTPENGEVFQRERMMIEVGAADNLPAFNEYLEGAAAGAELEFSVDYPAEYGAKELAGKTVAYQLNVHEVKRKEVPALDDEFAKDLGDFDDLEALREKVTSDLQARREQEANVAMRQSLLDKVLLENPIVLPEGLVEMEIRKRLEDGVRNMIYQGIDPETVQLDWEELRKSQEQPARKSVHARLVLDALAKLEAIEVGDDEIEERIRIDAERLGEKQEKLRAGLRKSGGLEALKGQLLREKSLDLLTSVANIQNEE